MNNNMNINLNEDLKRHFPPMPEELRSMVEQEVRKQIGAAPPVRRRKYRKRKILAATLAAAMLLGTTVAAGVVYKMHTEQVGKHAVQTKIEPAAPHINDRTSDNPVTQDATMQDVSMEVSYLPDGMVETEDGKYSYAENLCDLLCFISERGKILIKQRVVFAGIISENDRTFRGICQAVFRKNKKYF